MRPHALYADVAAAWQNLQRADDVQDAALGGNKRVRVNTEPETTVTRFTEERAAALMGRTRLVIVIGRLYLGLTTFAYFGGDFTDELLDMAVPYWFVLGKAPAIDGRTSCRRHQACFCTRS